MREYTNKPQKVSRTLDSNPKASRQVSVLEILQKNSNMIQRAIKVGAKSYTADELFQNLVSKPKYILDELKRLDANNVVFPDENMFRDYIFTFRLRRKVLIGIPYRGDGRGEAIKQDIELVNQSTGYRVVHIQDTADLKTLNITALYISGGPHDHPETIGEGRKREAGNRADEAHERHEREERLIKEALALNIPILAICGGSWRLGSLEGAKIERLGDVEKSHAGPMNKPHERKHDVIASPQSLLHRILDTGDYRQWVGKEPSADPIILPVNSVHWAQSVFPSDSHIKVTARSVEVGDVVEAFENPLKHFCMGIQWHPEYAQGGIGEYTQDSKEAKMHRAVITNLGQAGLDGMAARIIQKHVREFLLQLTLKRIREIRKDGRSREDQQFDIMMLLEKYKFR